MNPASIDAMSWEMAEVYGAITDQIVINLARYFPYLTAGKHPPKSMFDYQAAMLAQMGKVNAQTMQIIRNNLSDADRALSASLETAIADAIKDSEPSLYRGAKAGIFKPPTKPVLSANQTRAFGLYYKQAADKLNLVNTVMLESTQSAYMQTVSNVISEYEILERINRTQIALDVAAGETITGVSSWNQAVKHATDRLKEGGIVGFIDHGNHRWSAEAYVAMDVRTTVYNTARAAVWEENESFGNDLYIVSYHNGARPGCYDWQNKVISANNVSRDVVDLDGNPVHVYAQNETTYGEPAGLFGINCKHYPTPFVPGVSAVRGQVQDKAENDKQYAESQKQRALERNLREQKRDLEMMKAQNAPEDIIRAQREKVRAASKEIDDFCDETGRVRRRNREAVYTKRDFPSGNYDPSQFAREQQKRFDDYWKNGGTQSGFTFGQLVPNVPLVPNPAPVAPVENVASQATTTAAPEVQQNGFVPAKTRAEAEEYARQHFANNVNYNGLSIENANTVNKTLSELTEKYPTNRLEYLTQTGRQGSVARANYQKLEINGKKLGKVLDDETINFQISQAFDRNTIKEIRGRYEGRIIPSDMQRKIDKLESKLKFTRWGVHSSYDDHVKAVVTHEYGHILADQYFGMSNNAYANPHYDTNWSLRGMYDKWRQAYERAIRDGDIYKLSEYGNTNVKEFFAESFAAREFGETLPDYVESLFVEVFTNGIM